MKRKIYSFSALLLACVIGQKNLSAQTTYFTEYFDNSAASTIPSSSGAAPTTATDYVIGTGTWNLFQSYRGGSGCTPQDPVPASAKALRLLGSLTSYAITPKLDFGVSTITFKNAKAGNNPPTTGKSLDVYKSSNNGTSWTLVGNYPSPSTACTDVVVTINDASVNKIKFQNATTSDQDLDNVTIVSQTSFTAPVKFGGISATETNGFVKLSFGVLSEINTSKFVIERSNNAIEFAEAGSLTANNSEKYNWVDNNVVNGVAYYRIKAVDKDGSFMYSNIAKVTVGKKNTEIVVNPNPVKGGGLMNLQLNNFNKGTYSVRLLSNAGQQLMNTTVTTTGGSQIESIAMPPSIKAGIYQLQVVGTNVSLTKTVVVQ